MQMKDLRPALYSHGNYILTPEFSTFTTAHAVWQSKSEEKDEVLREFLAYTLKTKRTTVRSRPNIVTSWNQDSGNGHVLNRLESNNTQFCGNWFFSGPPLFPEEDNMSVFCRVSSIFYHHSRLCPSFELFAVLYSHLFWAVEQTDWICFIWPTESCTSDIKITRMWANAQRDGRPAEYRWCPLFIAAKFGRHPLLECHAVTLQDAKPVEICWGAPNSRTDLSR